MSWEKWGMLLEKWMLKPKCSFYISSYLAVRTKDLSKNHADFLAEMYKDTGKNIFYTQVSFSLLISCHLH